jgi:2-methylisocitrate lyase-like PEP mutase family enzyme
MDVASLADIGVRRVSTGGSLAAAAWAGFDNALQLLIEKGTLPKRG